MGIEGSGPLGCGVAPWYSGYNYKFFFADDHTRHWISPPTLPRVSTKPQSSKRVTGFCGMLGEGGGGVENQ